MYLKSRQIFYLFLGAEIIFIFGLVSLGCFNYNNSIYSIVLFAISFGEYLYVIYSYNKKDTLLMMIFICAYIVRCLLIYYDVNIHEIDPGDSADFRAGGEYFFYHDILMFRGRILKGFGTILLMGIINKIFGPQRFIVQYCGSLCFIGSAIITNQLLKRYNVKRSIRYILISWMLFTPQNIKNTSLSGREGFIQLFIAVSLYFAFMWTEHRRKRYMIGIVVPLILAMCMHSGTVGIVAGYVVWLAFYDKRRKKLSIKGKTVLVLLFSVIFLLIIYSRFSDVLFGKFSNLESITDIAKSSISSGYGGSGYSIPGSDADSISEIILYSPLRMIYFLLSPMPWDWRGLMDAIAFMICSVPQLIIAVQFVKRVVFGNRHKYTREKSIIIALMASAFACAFIFGWGCKNAGTAIRHRDKFLSLYVIILGVLSKLDGKTGKVFFIK